MRRHVLLVDEDEDFLSSLHEALERTFEGIDVHGVVSGRAALEMLRSQRVHLILCDPELRQYQARDFLLEARVLAPTVPQVILAASSQEKAQALKEAVKAEAVLLKPLTVQALTQTLAPYLGRTAPPMA